MSAKSRCCGDVGCIDKGASTTESTNTIKYPSWLEYVNMLYTLVSELKTETLAVQCRAECGCHRSSAHHDFLAHANEMLTNIIATLNLVV